MKNILLVTTILLVIISGCSQGNENSTPEENKKNEEPLHVAIQIPETIQLNEEITIQAEVTQGSEKVADANEVKFEIRQVGEGAGEMTLGTNEGEGTYSIKKAFSEGGKYFITAHVTARGTHSMPTEEVVIEDPAAEHQDETDKADSGHSHHHHHANVEIKFNQDQTFNLNEQVLLTTSILHDHAPLTDAVVTFEIWGDNREQPEWISTNEEANGTYSALKTFTKAGTYHVQIHIKKNDIHEHKTYMFDVK